MPDNVYELERGSNATSLHKWLNAPLGTGALFVRRDRLPELPPLYGYDWPADDIRKYEIIPGISSRRSLEQLFRQKR